MQVTEWTGREAHALRLALRMSVRGFAQHLGAAARTVSGWDARLETITPGHEMQAALDTVLERLDPTTRDRFTDLLMVGVSVAADARPAVHAILHAGSAPTPMDARGGNTASNPGQSPGDALASGSAPAYIVNQRHWLATRGDLNKRRAGLAQIAIELYQDVVRQPNTCLIAPKHWIPQAPVPIDEVRLQWSPGPQTRLVSGNEPAAATILPMRDQEHRYDRYTAAIRYLDPPTLFENRPSFRLLSVELQGSSPSLGFALSTYFEKLDVCEAIGHEFAAACAEPSARSQPPEWRDLPYRRAIGDPFNLHTRAVNPAITTLTILHDPQTDAASFLMHWRDASKVATAGGLYDVIPAGEFQPASIDPWHHESDLDLWRNIIREYSEELLGEPEHDGSRGEPVDYDHWSLYRNIVSARSEGRIRGFVLGVGLDALTLAATIPTVVVIDLATFEQIFGAAVAINAEGIVVADRAHRGALPGVPFTQANVERFLSREPLAAPGAACLALSWQHRQLLLP